MEEKKTSIKKINLNKTWLLVAGLVILTAILLVVSLTSKNFSPLSSNPKNEQVDFAHTSLSISEDIRPSTTSGRYEVDIIIDTDKDKIIGGQVELSYDSEVLKNVDIQPGSFINNPSVALKTIDPKNEVIRYAIGIKPGSINVKGKGIIATISFTKTDPEETYLNFLPQSVISTSAHNKSVLKETVSGVIGDLSNLSKSSISTTPEN